MLANKNKVLKKALFLFSERGPRVTTMDSIASGAGISKKTLYKFFGSKETLISTLYLRLMNYAEVKLRRTLDNADDAVLEYLNIAKLVLDFSRFFSPYVLRQLKQENAAVYRELRVFRKQFLPTVLSYNIERGIGSGLFKPEVDSNIMAHLSLTQLMSYNTGLHLLGHQHSGKEIRGQLLSCLIYGIATTEGSLLAQAYLQPSFNAVQV